MHAPRSFGRCSRTAYHRRSVSIIWSLISAGVTVGTGSAGGCASDPVLHRMYIWLATPPAVEPSAPNPLRYVCIVRYRSGNVGTKPLHKLFVHDPLDIDRCVSFTQSRQNGADLRVVFVVWRTHGDQANRVGLAEEARHMRV